MIETLTLHNFKAFKSLNELKTKPITIISGANSCGKSSILQSILLLKQTLESQNLDQNLCMNGRFVHLGTLKNVLFEQNLNNKLVFDLTLSLPIRPGTARQSGVTTLQERTTRALRAFFPRSERRYSTLTVHYAFTLVGTEAPTRGFSTPITLEHCSIEMQALGKDGYSTPGPRLTVSLADSTQGEPSAPNESPGKHRDEYLATLNGTLRPSRPGGLSFNHAEDGEGVFEIEFANLGIRALSEKVPSTATVDFDILYTYGRAYDLLKAALSSHRYIGPLREEPARRYIFEDDVLEIGTKGENAAYIYLTDQYDKVEEHYFFNHETESFELKESANLGASVQEWMALMGIHGFEPESSGELIRLGLNASSCSKLRVNIADVGFGVSQIFPIILEGLRMPTGDTLILEQPEIHLHPSLQMKLADYFIALGLSKKAIIIETHSEHIVNRLVRRIVEDQTHHLKDMIAIYFVTQGDEGSQYEEVLIDELDGVVNWPDGFFDQTASEQGQIMRAGLERRMSARANNGDD
jgi:predicted ATPase